MPHYYWTRESWGSDYPPENVDEIIDHANMEIDYYIFEHPDADDDEIVAFSEALWISYCLDSPA